MKIRSRLLALGIRTGLLITILTLFILIFLNGIEPWKLLCYSSIQCGIMLIALFTFEVIFNAIDLRRGVFGYSAGVYMPISLGVTLYSVTSGILMLSFSHQDLLASPIQLFFNIALIVLPLIDWIFIDEKGSVKWFMAFNYVFYPVLYVVFFLIRPYIWPDVYFEGGSKYPIAELDPKNQYFWPFVITTSALIILGGLLLIFLNNLFAGKYKKGSQIK